MSVIYYFITNNTVRYNEFKLLHLSLYISKCSRLYEKFANYPHSPLLDHVNEHKSHIVAIIESWLSSDDSINCVVTKECLEYGYKLFHAPRLHRREGGVALLIKDGINVIQQDHHPQRSFEYMELLITTISIHVHVVVIYRPPISKVNKFTKSQFIHDFSEFLEGLSTSSGRLLICGES